MSKYYTTPLAWVVRFTTSSVPAWQLDANNKRVKASGVLPNAPFRIYSEGSVSTPWGTGWTQSPSNGYVAIEKAPTKPGEVWAAYKVVGGVTIPPVSAQVSDSSAKSRRVWIKMDTPVEELSTEDSLATEAWGQLVYDEFGDLVGQQGPDKIFGKDTSLNMPQVNTSGSSPNATPGAGNDAGSPSEGGTSGSAAWLLWALAGASAVMGAPVAIPAALAAGAIAVGSKSYPQETN